MSVGDDDGKGGKDEEGDVAGDVSGDIPKPSQSRVCSTILCINTAEKSKSGLLEVTRAMDIAWAMDKMVMSGEEE